MLAAILSSSLASWFFLMTASTFGVSMRRLLLRDIEQMPVPDLEEALNSSAGRALTRLVRRPRRNMPSTHEWDELDQCVFDLYGLDDADRIAAADGLIRAGWQWQSGRLESAKPADVDTHVLDYADTFLTAVDAWLHAGGRRRMRGEVFASPPQRRTGSFASFWKKEPAPRREASSSRRAVCVMSSTGSASVSTFGLADRWSVNGRCAYTVPTKSSS